MTEARGARHRFAVDSNAVHAGEVRFPAEVARQMRRVLRLSPGDRVAAFVGSGAEYIVRLTTLRDDRAVGAVEAESLRDAEPKLGITLCQALLPREKFELVLRKATEIGVRAFVPLECERSLVPASALGTGRLERWRRIIQEAAEQSGRVNVPTLLEPLSLAAALAQLDGEPALFAWEQELQRSLREALSQLAHTLESGRLTLFVGPEGGFTGAEAASAQAAGAIIVSLGSRILRSETAGPVLAAIALYEAGDLEPRG